VPRTLLNNSAVWAVIARLPRTISLTRIGSTPIFLANAAWLILRGRRNSSSRISPGVTKAGPSGTLAVDSMATEVDRCNDVAGNDKYNS
jgi:hypothetical protein